MSVKLRLTLREFRREFMNSKQLTEEERLDIELLSRTVNIKDHFGSGEVILTLIKGDSVEQVGRLVKRALGHADGAVISVQQPE